MFCRTAAEEERDPVDTEWLETGPIAAVVAWLDVDRLIGMNARH